MRVAVISDVHGNLPALEAALAAAEAARPDLIVFGGDLVWGPLPRETLERVTAVPGAQFVRGDADRDVVEAITPVLDPDDPTNEVSNWCRERLTREQLEFLTAQPQTLYPQKPMRELDSLMAKDKLEEGIQGFSKALVSLEKQLAERLNAVTASASAS